ncbi:hypothetical protein CFP56_029859 [Quercus suber]|uniref:DUF4220 domain-containing protein n=1 Tax=Quercus suber TaxID=58331 RepID=A0AAW0JQ56_QUESU
MKTQIRHIRHGIKESTDDSPTVVGSIRQQHRFFTLGFVGSVRGELLKNFESLVMKKAEELENSSRRKYTSRTWIRIVLWCAYLMADWVATVALGVISNNLGEAMKSTGKDGSLNDGIQLTAFWAPFLLLHLGGPDTITAYSLEDNELWLRHLLGLSVQTGVAFYIFLIAWTGSQLSILSILMFFPGIIKYGERTWVLRSASNEQFRESMLTSPDPGPNYSKFMREYTVKQSEGFYVRADEVIEVQVEKPPSENETVDDAAELVIANDLFKSFKRLFVDLILGFDDRDNSQSLFGKFSWEEAFKVIEMELGFAYDVLYTKATVIYSTKGWCLRLISFSFTSIVLALFSVIYKNKYSIVDLVLTFLLLAIAILLEDKHRVFIGIQKRLCIDKFLEKYNYTTCEEVPDKLKELVFAHLEKKFKNLKKNSKDASDIRTLCSCRGGKVFEKYSNLGSVPGEGIDQTIPTGDNRPKPDWEILKLSVQVEFDQSILIWHIATDLCYHSDCTDQDTSMSNRELSKWLSQYMLYILVRRPFMLPMGVGMIRFRDTCAEVTQFFEERKSIASPSDAVTLDKSQACEILLKVNTEVAPNKVKGDRSKSVLFDACKLASELQAISDENQKWEMISNVWVEMLAYAACHCRGNYHAQQLRRGGELLTHVWLLMAHFGLTEQFQISQGHARAKLVVE